LYKVLKSLSRERKEMAEVIPFRGILYNITKIKSGDVVAPPYDIITPELRDVLYRKSPYNIVRIDAGLEQPGDDGGENKYERAARSMRKWMEDGILQRSEKPCFYAYEMDYRSGGERKRLHGFFGLVRLRELGEGVYPHEETHSTPKVDRLNLMRACEANTSPVFSLYHSEGREASGVVEEALKENPYMEAEDGDGSIHRLWVIAAEEQTAAITRDLSDKAIYIADGHHRYETALEYRRIMNEKSVSVTGSEPYNYVLMFLANIADRNITILPAHRIVKFSRGNALDRLSGHFEIQTMSLDDDIIEAMKGKAQTFGFFQRGGKSQYLLKYRGGGLTEIHPALKGLDVTILHELVLKGLLEVSGIRYEMDPSVARRTVVEGGYDAVFFLNPTRVEDVEKVALSSMRMPPKSTYFYPKIMTGFVINSLRNS
jgi:uncharacterized protein (DUF1015 family)